jgi:hypothetical protein
LKSRDSFIQKRALSRRTSRIHKSRRAIVLRSR